MTGSEAARVAAFLQGQYPGRDVRVKRVSGGLRAEVRGDGWSFVAVIGSEHSPVLAALKAYPKRTW